MAMVELRFLSLQPMSSQIFWSYLAWSIKGEVRFQGVRFSNCRLLYALAAVWVRENIL
jgi:hypothetical protein